jgi:hypothetical protein
MSGRRRSSSIQAPRIVGEPAATYERASDEHYRDMLEIVEHIYGRRVMLPDSSRPRTICSASRRLSTPSSTKSLTTLHRLQLSGDSLRKKAPQTIAA